MQDPYIHVKNATLRYPIGPFVRGSLKSNLMRVFGHREQTTREFKFVQALSDISFKIESGERVGIIGSNGSGKSTLLRAMAGIYPLAEGLIDLHGKVQNLFDLSLGFEAEATGRENITYRGLVMGATFGEINERAEEIIEFAGLGDFIDLPVRMYSAGMMVRLAFAISSHLNGDILLIDEVFGAGDAQFQAKAVDRMMSIINSAKIVVFVTHDLGTIQKICNRVIWLDRSEIRMEGDAAEVCEAYLQEQTA